MAKQKIVRIRPEHVQDYQYARAELLISALKSGVEEMLKTTRGAHFFGAAAIVQFNTETGNLEIITDETIYKIEFA